MCPKVSDLHSYFISRVILLYLPHRILGSSPHFIEWHVPNCLMKVVLNSLFRIAFKAFVALFLIVCTSSNCCPLSDNFNFFNRRMQVGRAIKYCVLKNIATRHSLHMLVIIVVKQLITASSKRWSFSSNGVSQLFIAWR